MAAAKRKTDIPLHQMEMSNKLGLEIKYIRSEENHMLHPHVQQAHSDDHYIFFLVKAGELDFMVDFKKLHLESQMLGFILPGQVHHYAKSVLPLKGWFLAVDTSLIDARYRVVFEDKLLGKQTVTIADTTMVEQCLSLITQHVADKDRAHGISIVHSFLSAFVGMAAAAFCQDVTMQQRVSGRAATITSEFRELVAKDFASQKKPSDYAAQMNISTAYLNEVLQQQTGASSTYWIQQEVMLAAKRLLYHTDLTVKEVAHNIGFADHAYFSRLFQKNVKLTPLTFRARYRESSNLVLQ